VSLAAPVGLRLKDYKVAGRNNFILGPISCDIPPGHFTCLIGPAQSGKSLLLAALCGLIPHGGEQELLGTASNVHSHPIQLIFQEGGLLENQTVGDNLTLAQRAFGSPDLQTQHQLLERLDIVQTPALYPRELSGGMRKRVLLARALLCRPSILLIDHVTAGLDPQNAQKLMTLVLDLKKEQQFTLVWVTHEPGLMLSHLDQVLFLQEGRLSFDGLPHIATKEASYQPYFQV
jgi:ABC-type multidrug transport system ATPase subunit